MRVPQPYDYVATVWSFGDRGTINAGLSRYLAAPGGTGLAGNELGVVALHPGTLRNLRWSCAASTLDGVGNRITVYLNGTPTKLVATWDGPATSGYSKVEMPIPLKGDTLSVRIELATGPGTGRQITRPRVSVELALPSDSPWVSNGSALYYDGGMVGIGTDSPAAMLSVKGMIESIDQGVRFPDGTVQTTAFVPPSVPVIPSGSVIAYAGAVTPAGWLLCDGSFVDRVAFADLFAAIGTAHGEGDGSTTFALPDYRGWFLRGVSGSSPIDPDADERFSFPAGAGGDVGNAVGSKQWDLMGLHHHSLGVGGADSFQMAPGGATQRLAHFELDQYNAGSPKVSGPAGDSETRPRNAYVNFLIKI